MIRRLATFPFFGLLMLLTHADAQDTAKTKKNKEEKKGLPRIEIYDPKEVTPDYNIQGEYAGKLTKGDTTLDYGVQLITQPGQKKFNVVVFQGGLPGNGYDGQTKISFSVEMQEGKLISSSKDYNLQLEGENFVFSGTFMGKVSKVNRQSKTIGVAPPSGAKILFQTPEDVKNWENAKVEELSDGKFLACQPGKNIVTKDKFQAFKMHMEFRLAYMPNSTGQGRSNSGLYLQNRYECQILDSFGLRGANNECCGFYQQFEPKVNMCFPPLVWQTYDIEFTSAQFDSAGKRTKAPVISVYHNGELVHDKIEMKGPTAGGQKEGPDAGPLQLQWHGDKLVYRNIWILETK